MHELGRDIGCDPSIRDLLARSPGSLLAWAMGQVWILVCLLAYHYRCSAALCWSSVRDSI